jgi:tetratricopeptide (TPR) repeat protein
LRSPLSQLMPCLHPKLPELPNLLPSKLKIPVKEDTVLALSSNTFLRLGLVDLGVEAPSATAAAEPKADDFFLQGNKNYETREYRKAIANYSRAIELNPKYANAYNNRGLIYSELKQYKEAIADFDEAIALNSQDILVYYN